MEPLAVDVAEAARLMGLSRAKCYELVMAGDVPLMKLGRRRLVPVEGLRDFLDSQSEPATK